MFAIEVGCLVERDEELRAVGVRAGVSHRELEGLSMLDREVLIFELLTVDRLTSCTVASSEITTLGHEAWNDAMELAALVAEWNATGGRTSGARRQLGEVVSGLGDGVAIQAENNSAGIMTVDFQIEIDALGDGLVG